MSPRRSPSHLHASPTGPLGRARRIPVGLCFTIATSALASSAWADAPSEPAALERPAEAAPPALPSENKAPSEVKAPSLPLLPPEYVSEDEGWLHLGYHPSVRERLRVVMPRISEMRDELRASLGTDVLDEVEIRIAALEVEMVRLTPGETVPPANGAAFEDRHLIVLTAGSKPGADAQDLEVGIRYHLARLALAEAVARSPGLATSDDDGARGMARENAGAGGASAATPHVASHVPAWFVEGFATSFARGHEATRSEALLLAALRGLPHLRDVERGAQGDEGAFAADFVRFVSETNDGAALPLVVEKLRKGTDLDDALASALGSDFSGVDSAWRKDMGRRYGLFPVLALSFVLWIALWLVGIVRRRNARASNEAARVRLRTLRRALPLDADGLSSGPRSKRDSASPPRRAVETAGQHDVVYADQPSVGTSGEGTSGRRAAPRDVQIEVPRVEHDGDWHTLH